MPRVTPRRLALAIFLLVTLGFVVAGVYAAQYYLEIIGSVQSVEADVSSFEISFVDSSAGKLTFLLVIRNPSGAPMKVQLASYTLYLNGKFLAARAVDYSYHGLEVPPNSSPAFPISTQLTSGEVKTIRQASTGGTSVWQVNGIVRLRTAIGSDIQIQFSESWTGQSTS